MEMDRELLDDANTPNVISSILKSQQFHDMTLYSTGNNIGINKNIIEHVSEIEKKIININSKMTSADELLEYAVKTNTCVGNMMQIHARQSLKYKTQIKTLEWMLNIINHDVDKL